MYYEDRLTISGMMRTVDLFVCIAVNVCQYQGHYRAPRLQWHRLQWHSKKLPSYSDTFLNPNWTFIHKNVWLQWHSKDLPGYSDTF